MMNAKTFFLTLALGATTCLLFAQNPAPRTPGAPGGQGGPGGPGGQGGPGGPGGPGGARFQPNALIATLDLNKDGTLDADEIAKASDSLKKLDRNGDGKVTPDEYRPQRLGPPPGAPGAPGGQGGAGGAAGAPGAPGAPGGAGAPPRTPPPPKN